MSDVAADISVSNAVPMTSGAKLLVRRAGTTSEYVDLTPMDQAARNATIQRLRAEGKKAERLAALRKGVGGGQGRPSPRTPRRPRSAPRPAAARVDSDDGPPGPPPGPLVPQGNSGLPRRVYLATVRDRNIPHVRIGRLVVCRLEDLLAALGLGQKVETKPAEPAWSPDVVLRAIRGGK